MGDIGVLGSGERRARQSAASRDQCRNAARRAERLPNVMIGIVL